MIINKKSGEFCLENLPEDEETLKQAVKDKFFELLSDTITAALRHMVYSSNMESIEIVSPKEKPFVNDEKLLAIYVSFALSGEEKEGGNFLVKLVVPSDD